MTRLVAMSVVAAMVSTTDGATVEVQPNVVYAGGTRLEASDLGVALTVPEGWRGSWPAGSSVFLLQPEADPMVTILVLTEEGTRDEIAAIMAAPIELGNGLILNPTVSVTQRGRALSAHYDVHRASTPHAAYGEALAGNHGVSLAFLLIATPTSIADHEPVLRSLVDDAELGPPAGQVAQGTGGGAAGAETTKSSVSDQGDLWDFYLRGKYLVRYYTATGFTDEQHLWLCSDGTFRRRGASGGFGGGFGGGASGAFDATSSGRWTATGSGADGKLTLHYGDGNVAQHGLRWDYGENKLFVDGKRWLHGTNEVCQ